MFSKFPLPCSEDQALHQFTFPVIHHGGAIFQTFCYFKLFASKLMLYITQQRTPRFIIYFMPSASLMNLAYPKKT